LLHSLSLPRSNGRRADHLSMIPGTARSVQFSTANAGFWLMHCHVGDHIKAGMKATYQVDAAEGQDTLSTVAATATGTVR
jgi:hephaestin